LYVHDSSLLVLLSSVSLLPFQSPPPPVPDPLSLHDALPIYRGRRSGDRSERGGREGRRPRGDRSRGPRPSSVPERSFAPVDAARLEEHTSELQSRFDLVCRLLLEKKKKERTHRDPKCDAKSS